MDGFDADPDRDHDERAGVDKGGQNAGALIAKGPGIIRRAGLEVDAAKLSSRARKSETLWPDSESSARECARRPATNVTAT